MIPRFYETRAPVLIVLFMLCGSACFSDPSATGAEDMNTESGSDSGSTTTADTPTATTTDTSSSTEPSTGRPPTTDSASTTNIETSAADTTSAETTAAESSGTGVEPLCGDEQVQGPEECDDGNLVANDGCESNCITSGVAQVSVGRTHVCALTRAGTVRCFGVSTHGELGYADLETIGDDEDPYEVGDVDTGEISIVSVHSGLRHTCALREDGNVICWGDGQSGRLGYANLQDIGDDETPASAGFVNVGGTVEQLTVGEQHNCALLDTGAVRCWGLNFQGAVLGYGDIGNIGDTEDPAFAGDIDFGGASMIQVEAGFTHSCALSDAGDVYCWGLNDSGKLGVGSLDSAPTPIKAAVELGGAARRVLAGASTSCAIMSDDDLICWGEGGFWALGTQSNADIGDDEAANAGGDIPLGFNVQQVAGEGFHHCALSETGQVYCWGSPAFGRVGHGDLAIIGDDEDPSEHAPVAIGGPATAISANVESTCALRDDHQVVCWGRNDDARIGIQGGANIGDDEFPTNVGPVPILDLP